MAFLPKLMNGNAGERAEVINIQKGILDATQTSAKAAGYQSEQLEYQSELLDTMVSAIRSLQRAIVSGVKVGNMQGATAPRAFTRSTQSDAPEKLTRVKTAEGKVVWKNSKGQFASKSAAEAKERDDAMMVIFSGIEVAIGYMNEKITEQTAMLDMVVRSNRSMSAFLKTFVRRVSDDKKKASALDESKDLEEENDKANERNKKKGDVEERSRGRKFSNWESILDGLAGILKTLLIPLVLGFADGLDKSTGWIGKTVDGFKTLCGWIGDAITAFNNWFSGDDKHVGVFNKLLDHIHDIFSAIADFDPRDVIKKILTSLPASVQKVLPDALLRYAGLGKYQKIDESESQTVDRKNRENIVGAKFESKMDKDQQAQFNSIGERIQKQGYATSEDKAQLNKIIHDSRGILGRTFGSDEDQQRYVNVYVDQKANRNKRMAAAAASGGDGSFNSLIGDTLKIEGGYVANDAGKGPTNLGINSQANKSYLDKLGVSDVKDLTEDQAKEIYKMKYWDAVGINGIPEQFRRMVFDAAVNQGEGYAKGLVAKIKSGEIKNLDQLRDERKRRYNAIANHDPTKKKYLDQWTARVDKVYNQSAADMSNVPPLVPATTSSSGAQLADAKQASQPQTINQPVAAVNAPVSNVTNNQTINQPVQSATTPAEFRAHV